MPESPGTASGPGPDSGRSPAVRTTAARTTAALSPADAEVVRRVLDAAASELPTTLPGPVRAAVADLLERFAAGETVLVSSVESLLTTAQAASAAGISHTYLRRLTDQGIIPVEYRGTHRRIRLQDVLAWRQSQRGTGQTGVEDGA